MTFIPKGTTAFLTGFHLISVKIALLRANFWSCSIMVIRELQYTKFKSPSLTGNITTHYVFLIFVEISIFKLCVGTLLTVEYFSVIFICLCRMTIPHLVLGVLDLYDNILWASQCQLDINNDNFTHLRFTRIMWTVSYLFIQSFKVDQVPFPLLYFFPNVHFMQILTWQLISQSQT